MEYGVLGFGCTEMGKDSKEGGVTPFGASDNIFVPVLLMPSCRALCFEISSNAQPPFGARLITCLWLGFEQELSAWEASEALLLKR